eukprot:3892335-Amphidinium_carterae.1
MGCISQSRDKKTVDLKGRSTNPVMSYKTHAGLRYAELPAANRVSNSHMFCLLVRGFGPFGEVQCCLLRLGNSNV